MSFMNPLTEPGMEPTQTRDPAVPEPVASPEPASRLAGSFASQMVTEPEPTEPASAGSDPDGGEPVAAEPVAAEPVAAEPVAAEPVAAEPVAAEPPDALILSPSEAMVAEVAAPESASGEPASADAVSSDAVSSDAVSGEAAAGEITVRMQLPDAAPTARGHGPGAARAAARHTWSFASGTMTLIGRHKLETVAVLLLGVGGAVYLPVWILGVLAALPSRTWDLRDKWTGLVAPVLLVIVSTVLIVVFGGKHATLGSYAFEAWLGAGRVSRVATVLGAGYLAWRLRRGRREPKQPPWDVPHV